MVSKNSRAFVDTSVLCDALLGDRDASVAARNAFARFSEVQHPVYSVKELSAGPLRNFVWMHNQLLMERSLSRALGRLQRMSLTPRRYTTATAIQALAAACRKPATLEELSRKYGAQADPDVALADSFRLSIKTKVASGWRRRYSHGVAVCPIPCFAETAPREGRGGRLELDSPCHGTEKCSMSDALRARVQGLRSLRDAVMAKGSARREDLKRAQALKQVIKGRPVTPQLCRDLGDAVIALFAPDDSVILTTNAQDFEGLARVLGKQCASP